MEKIHYSLQAATLVVALSVIKPAVSLSDGERKARVKLKGLRYGPGATSAIDRLKEYVFLPRSLWIRLS